MFELVVLENLDLTKDKMQTEVMAEKVAKKPTKRSVERDIKHIQNKLHKNIKLISRQNPNLIQTVRS